MAGMREGYRMWFERHGLVHASVEAGDGAIEESSKRCGDIASLPSKIIVNVLNILIIVI